MTTEAFKEMKRQVKGLIYLAQRYEPVRKRRRSISKQKPERLELLLYENSDGRVWSRYLNHEEAILRNLPTDIVQTGSDNRGSDNKGGIFYFTDNEAESRFKSEGLKDEHCGDIWSAQLIEKLMPGVTRYDVVDWMYASSDNYTKMHKMRALIMDKTSGWTQEQRSKAQEEWSANIDQWRNEIKGPENQKQDFVGKLISQGFYEEDAHVVLHLFEREIQDASPVPVKSKCQVYYITDKNGSKKTVKIAADSNEADMDAKVAYHFPRLGFDHVVPKGAIIPSEEQKADDAIPVMIRGKQYYATIQEDIRDKVNPWFEYARDHGTKAEFMEYLKYWARAFADLHVYGTQIMKELSKKKAWRFSTEKDDERAESVNLDTKLRKDIIARGLESGHKFIHQDATDANRMGQYLIDWGNAGEGEGIVDPIWPMSDYSAARHNLTPEDHKIVFNEYLTREHSNLQIQAPTEQDVNNAYDKSIPLKYLLLGKRSGYLLQKGNECSAKELKSKEFADSQLPVLEKQLRKNLVTVDANIRREEQKDKVIYYLPQRKDLAA
jgi:hypothetical protein